MCVSSVCAIAEEDSQMCEMWKSEGGVLSNELCDGYNERQLQNVLSSVSQWSGNTHGCVLWVSVRWKLWKVRKW